MNDICSVSKLLFTLLYADDTCVLLSGKDLNDLIAVLKGTDQAGTFMSLKCVVYYANYRSWHQSSKIQVVS